MKSAHSEHTPPEGYTHSLPDDGEPAREALSEIAAELVQDAKTVLDRYSLHSATDLEQLARSVRIGAARLRSGGEYAVADKIDGLAEKFEQGADYLRVTDADELLRTLGGFLKRHREITAGAAIIAALTLAFGKKPIT